MGSKFINPAGQLLLQAQQLVSLEKPAERDRASVQNYLETTPVPLLVEDGVFVYEKDDLVTLQAGRENAWLDACVERLLKYCRCRLIDVCNLQYLWSHPWLLTFKVVFIQV